MAGSITRILSDVHYGDASSLVRTPAALRPLFTGADTVIFNGDTVETRSSATSQLLQKRRKEFLAFASEVGPRVVFIAGNHDPDISPLYHLDLADGQILLTHGEVIFEKLVPWGWDRHIIYPLYRTALAKLSTADQNTLEGRLGAAKEVMRRLEATRHVPSGGFRRGLLGMAVRFWPPWTPFLMVGTWLAVPYRGAALVRKFRPAARFLIIGHTHFPGAWTRDGVTVINTGAYMYPFGSLAVDLESGKLTVRKVLNKGGEFTLGPVTAQFTLATSTTPAFQAIPS